MTRDDVVRLAEQVGLVQDGDAWFSDTAEAQDVTTDDLVKLAGLVEQHLRTAQRAEHKMAAAELRRLHAQRQALLEALKLALSSHGVLLLSDPPQDAWKTRRVEEIARAAIKAAEERA